ncbi:pantoate--beta-alanine ligase [Anaerosinus gibii]|uniref:Pantothenate synthetase n=1 Tax=Selenobaculum gibii TaxID=3054208 RepID=A0A9Y2ETD5_9FIRM|nr:pantoate--beta-alanine ligase [Selenobaculum gbiensis]WIW71988.1 pantoate--beta-alanine ligase [Selenobaculum gbiensis]
MKVLTTVAEVKSFVRAVKKAGKTIGLVPTMGALHEGHLTLMRHAKKNADVVIASVFVNPTQFGPNEDFDAYPRGFSRDCEKLDSVGVDAVFHPSAEEMYPKGYTAYVTVDGDITNKLCGAKRPGHFRGVATVVTKLFNITEADKAFFGQKDAQQVVVIKRFVRDLNMNVEVNMVPIVRAEDGLALSSRNKYLSDKEKKAALVLSKSLKEAQKAFKSGKKSVTELKALITEKIQAEPLAQIDYIDIYTFPDLEECEMIAKEALVALAVKFGTTRLIDNTILGGE